MNTIRLTTLLLCIWVTTCHAEQITVVASKDTTIFEENDALSNGSGSHLFVGRTAGRQGTTFRRALLAFDLTDVPKGATVTEASLTMRMNMTRGSATDVSLHRLTKGFGEGASDASGPEGKGTRAAEGDATWSDAVLGEIFWDEPGGDFVAEASSVARVGGTGNHTWDSTEFLVADAQLWIDDPDMNHGWILIGDEQRSTTAKRFDSKIGRNPPTLTIDFELAALLGDCNGDGVLDADDLACLTTIEERDAVLAAIPTLAGDLDGNGDVSFADFLVLSTNFNQDLPGYTDGNINLEGNVGFPDFLILSTNFNKTPPGAAADLGNAASNASLASVPEPSTICLSILAVLVMACRRGQRL